MLYEVKQRFADTCGNTWNDGGDIFYVEANNLVEVHIKFPKYEGLGGWDVKRLSIIHVDVARMQHDARNRKGKL